MSQARRPCIDCRNPQTHGQERAEVDRLMAAGFARSEARDLMPRCRRCVVAYLIRHPKPARMTK